MNFRRPFFLTRFAIWWLLGMHLASAADHRHGPTGTYTEWNWPQVPVNEDGKEGFLSFEHTLVIELEPEEGVGYFWSHQVSLKKGETAYFGLQTLGRRPDDSEGKVAIFSIWNALGARGPGLAKKFDGEGEGYHVIVPYDWQVGRHYRLRLFKSGSSRKGTEWSAEVIDEATEEASLIGTITVPKKWAYLDNWSVMWSERYTGKEIHDCSDVEHSKVWFETPTANGGSVKPEKHRNYTTEPANCPNSRVRDKGNGVRHEMGVPK